MKQNLKRARQRMLLVLSAASLLAHGLQAQTCSSPLPLTVNDCNNIGMSDTVTWLSFNSGTDATSCIITVSLSPSTPNAISAVELYSGTCLSSNLLQVGYYDQSSFVIATNLMPITNYRIKVIRPSAVTSQYAVCTNVITTAIVPCPPCNTQLCQVVCNHDLELYAFTNITGPAMFTSFNVCNWTKPNGTPDYHNANATATSHVRVPNNFAGTEPAHSGVGYGGIFCYYNNPHMANDSNYREYIQTQLSQPLVANNSYAVSFWVSLSDYSGYAIDHMGAYFSTSQPSQASAYTVINASPQVVWTLGAINQINGWTQVTGTFTPSASGTYWMTIGSFESDAQQSHPVVVPAGNDTTVTQPHWGSYYYIDDITVEPSYGVSMTYAPNPLCAASTTSLTITAYSPLSNGTYSWSVPAGVNWSCLNAGCSSILVTPPFNTNATYQVSTNFPTYGNCLATGSIHPNWSQGPTSVSAGIDQTICQGSSTLLSGTANGTYDQTSWQVLNGPILCTGCSTVTVSPSTPTYYVFSATNSSTGCSLSDTMHVQITAPLIGINGVMFGCDTAALYCPSFPYPFATYTWSAWDASYSNSVAFTAQSSNCIMVDWLNDNAGGAGHVILMVSVPPQGCTATDTFDIVACCRNPLNGNFFYNTSISAVTPNNPADFQGVNPYFNGTIVIDVDTRFQSSDINMGPYARIEVSGGNTLRLEEDSVKGSCCEMWDAIEGMSINDSIIIYRNTYIGDGIRGVVSNNGSPYKVYGNVTFNRNLTSITVNGYVGNHGGTVEQSLFESIDVTYCPAINGTMLPPYSGQYPESGIYANKVDSIVFGNPVSQFAKNTFTGLKNGIITKKTTSGIYNNDFTSVNRAGANSKAVYATGSFTPIFGNHKHVKVGGSGMGGYEKNTFTDCPYGVYTDTAISVWVQGNTFKYTFLGVLNNMNGTAIAVNRNIGFFDMNVNILNDTILNYGVGISCNQNNLCNTLIKQNYIDRTLGGVTNNGTGISIFCDPGNAGLNNVYINEVYGMRFGIIANTVNSVIINNNWIKVRLVGASFFAARGITVLNSTKPTVVSNTVTRDNPGPNVTQQNIGCIYVSNCSGGVVNCNILDKLAYGIQFTGAGSTSMTVFKNSMKNHVYGIWLSNGAAIGQQGNPNLAQDNRWQGSFTFRCYTSGGTLGNLSSFYYRPNGNTYNPNPSGSAAGPNTPMPALVTSTNSPQTFCTYVVPPGQHHGLKQQIAQGQLQYNGNQTAGTLISKEGLYRVISLDSTVIIGDSVLISFRDSADQANIGKMNSAQGVHAMRSYSSPSAISIAISDVNALIPAANTEHHDKTIERILFNQLQSGVSFTNAEIDTLRSIAELCPFTDGNAVYVARGLLIPFGDTIYENQCESAPANSNRTMELSVEGSAEVIIKVYPNPSDGNVTLEYQLIEGEAGQFDVYSVTGSLVYSIVLEAGQGITNIVLPVLEAGMYSYRFIVNGEMKKSDRLIIIK